MFQYSTLARTPSGALTAESKRIIKREDAEQAARSAERYRKAVARRDALVSLEEATDLYEAVTDYEDNDAQTEREERLIKVAKQEAIDEFSAYDLTEESALKLYNDLADTWGFRGAVYNQIYRMKYNGLDLELSTMEILEKLLDEEEGRD